MAKKKKSIESVLANAEKFFNRGNFLLAQREFEKAQKKLQRDDIAGKIKICQKENRAVRAKELIKKGHRAVGKNDLKGALTHFKQALTLQNEPESWLQERINKLENERLAGCADADASKAESAGDFAEAAELYTVAAEKMGDTNLLLKSTSCLVRAGAYSEAVLRFSQLANQEQEQEISLQGYGERFVYDYGFALAKTGCYTRALDVLKPLLDKNEAFFQQKREIFTLAVYELCKKFKKVDNLSDQHLKLLDQPLKISDQPLDPLSKILYIFAQADELYALSLDLGNDSQQQLLEKIVKYLQYELIEAAWNKGDYKTVSYRLEQFLVDINDHRILSLKAKTAFHLSRNNPESLKTMVAYWLTAVYSTEIARHFSSDPLQRENIQHKLIKLAESVANSHVDTPEGKFAIKSLKLEKKLIADLLKIAWKSEAEKTDFVEKTNCAEENFTETNDFAEENFIKTNDFTEATFTKTDDFTEANNFAALICTPRYASLFGLSARVLNLIASNRDVFDDTAHCLYTGGYYCRAWESLYMMKTGEMDSAIEHLNSLPRESLTDEFSRYVKQLVNFEYGKTAIERGEKSFLKYFDETHILFEINPAIEKKFTEFLHEFQKIEPLQKYEQVLSLLYTCNPSENMAQTFAFIMMQSGISRANKGILQPRALKIVAQNALELDPDNEYAREALHSVEITEEIDEMMTAMSRRKFAKASKIVHASEHAEVKDFYFEQLDDYAGQLENEYDDHEFAMLLMREMYDWAKRVDPFHPVVKRMRMTLDKGVDKL